MPITYIMIYLGVFTMVKNRGWYIQWQPSLQNYSVNRNARVDKEDQIWGQNSANLILCMRGYVRVCKNDRLLLPLSFLMTLCQGLLLKELWLKKHINACLMPIAADVPASYYFDILLLIYRIYEPTRVHTYIEKQF